MKKTLMLGAILFLAMGSGCAAYLGDVSVSDDGEAEILAIHDWNGYLSDDSANDIDPYIFRDGSNTYLVFSSDRSGNYDLYIARMASNGRFERPVALSNVNTSSDEKCPNLCMYEEYNYSSGFFDTNYYLTYIETSGGSTNLIRDFFYPESLSIERQTNFTLPVAFVDVDRFNPSYFTVLTSDGVIIHCYYYAQTFEPTTNTNNSLLKSIRNTESIDVMSVNYSPYIASFKSQNRFQLGMWLYQSGLSNAYQNYMIPAYSVNADEISPFVDVEDGYRVYFASKRAGKGNYDLYRYNKHNFSNTVYAAFPWMTNVIGK